MSEILDAAELAARVVWDESSRADCPLEVCLGVLISQVFAEVDAMKRASCPEEPGLFPCYDFSTRGAPNTCELDLMGYERPLRSAVDDGPDPFEDGVLYDQ